MDDLLKDAIADAKAVRETALENAKIALEEAFTPRLQSMLSKKIQSEIEVDEGEHEDDEDVEERMDDEDEVEERSKMRRDGDEIEDEAMHGDDEEKVDEEEEDEVEEGIIEIDGVKYAPVVSEEEDEDEMEEGEERGEDDDMDEDLDLDEILKELDEEEDKEEVDEIEEGEHDDEEKVDENDVSSGVGKSDNAHDKKSGDSTDIGKAGKAKHESVEAISEEEDDEDKKDESVEEDIDLEEIVKALSEEEDDEEEKNEVAELQSELDEHRNVVKYLRSKLNEVNLLNAKLLFTNKLFRSYGLNNDQKMKVVETFDRAHNLREVKLVYSTLAESFGSKQTKTEIKESKGSASKPVASTKSEKQEVISEGHELRDRFKKLAGIL